MQFERIQDEAELCEIFDYLNTQDVVAVDTETTGLDRHKDTLLSIVVGTAEESFSFDPKWADALLDLNGTLIFQNHKFDYHMLRRVGVDLRGHKMRDIMLLDHLVDENQEHGLDAMVQRHFQDPYKAEFWAKYDDMAAAPEDERLEYEGKDVCYTARLYRIKLAELREQGVPDSLVEHVHRLAAALYDTEAAGIKVDLEYCTSMGAELKADIIKTERELREMGGVHCEILELEQWYKEINKFKTDKKRQSVPKPEFNFNASGQVARLLYEQMKLPVQMNKKTKRPTTDAKALEKLAPLHPIPAKLMHHSKITTMYGTFIQGVLERAQGDVIYPKFNENGTVTGRISHSDPNMGNIPSKGDWVKIRGIFIPSPGNKLGTADYGQLEVCIAAHYSQDKNLLRIIHEGASQHDITAEGMGIARSLAKTINFALQYGATHHKIAEILNCSEKDGLAALGKYWETYAGLKKFVDWCHGKLDAGEPIANPFGRLRRFPKKFNNPWERASAQRQVFSSLIQGTGGDMMSCAFYRTAETLKARGIGRGWFTVHDEGLIEAPERHFEEAQKCLVDNMLAIGPEIKLTVPLKVSPSGALDRWEK